jgi:hypothetical protein
MSGPVACVLAVCLAAAAGGAGCGGSHAVAWQGQPRSGAIEGGQMLFGRLVNRSHRPLTLRAAQVRVVDGSGHALPSAAAFAAGYNPGIALRGFGAEMFALSGGDPGTGSRAVVAPGATVPLSVSWKGPAKAIVVAGTSLALH